MCPFCVCVRVRRVIATVSGLATWEAFEASSAAASFPLGIGSSELKCRIVDVVEYSNCFYPSMLNRRRRFPEQYDHDVPPVRQWPIRVGADDWSLHASRHPEAAAGIAPSPNMGGGRGGDSALTIPQIGSI